MSAAKKIKILLIERDMTLTELSKRLNKTVATMSDKLKRDNFSEKDLKQIADILNYDYEAIFTDRETGKKIYRESIERSLHLCINIAHFLSYYLWTAIGCPCKDEWSKEPERNR